MATIAPVRPIPAEQCTMIGFFVPRMHDNKTLNTVTFRGHSSIVSISNKKFSVILKGFAKRNCINRFRLQGLASTWMHTPSRLYYDLKAYLLIQ